MILLATNKISAQKYSVR